MTNYNGNAKSSEKRGDIAQYVSSVNPLTAHQFPSSILPSLLTIQFSFHHKRFQHRTNPPPRDDVRELMSLISTLRGFPSSENTDIYGLDTKLDFATFEIQWSNQEDDPAAAATVEGEQKDEFKRVVGSIEALGRQFAKQDSAI